MSPRALSPGAREAQCGQLPRSQVLYRNKLAETLQQIEELFDSGDYKR